MIRLGIREWIFIVLLFATPLGMWLMVFKPRKEADAAMLEEIQTKTQTLQQLDKARVSAEEKLNREIEGLQSAIDMVQSRVPQEADTDRILRGLTKLAQDHSLRKKHFEIGKNDGVIEIPDGYADESIKLRLEGTFENFYAFVQELERQPRIIRVNHLRVSRVRARPDEHCDRINAELDLQIFHARKDSEDD